jgi:hypothetical protein
LTISLVEGGTLVGATGFAPPAARAVGPARALETHRKLDCGEVGLQERPIST